MFRSLACRLPLVVIVGAVTLAASQIAAGQTTRREAELDRIREQYEGLRSELRGELDEIVRFCEDRGLAEAAATVRSVVVDEPDDGRIAITPLPREMQPQLPPGLPADERTWRSRVLKAKGDYAGKLYLLARRTLASGFPSRAFAYVNEVAEFDPDHEQARSLLGWVPYNGEWVTPFDRSMTIKRNEWHARFGWLPRTHVARYENGERYLTDANGRNGQWVPAAHEANVRRDFRNAWQIETAHYLVKTNHSLEEGVRIGRALELYHDFFKQVFAGFFVSPDQQKTLFDGGTRRGRREEPRKHVVHFYRSKEDYVAALAGQFPQIAITNGLYQSGDRVAYFFHDPSGENLPTIFHEATHQLFYESDPRPRDVALDAQFWIIEGIACYMESFERIDGKLTCGNPEYVRFDNARFRLLQSGDYQPFAEFSGLGMREFQLGGADELGIRYSQASGLSHFLMHYDRGRYRDALVVHLAELYSPAPPRRMHTLPELLGVEARVLDEQYREFLTAQSRDLVRREP
jgi:hypothetical protein